MLRQSQGEKEMRKVCDELARAVSVQQQVARGCAKERERKRETESSSSSAFNFH